MRTAMKSLLASSACNVIALPVGTFSDRVISYKEGGEMQVTSVSQVDLYADLDEVLNLDGPPPKSAKPMSEVVQPDLGHCRAGNSAK